AGDDPPEPLQREDTPAELRDREDGERDHRLAVLAVHADRGGVDGSRADRRDGGGRDRRSDRQRSATRAGPGDRSRRGGSRHGVPPNSEPRWFRASYSAWADRVPRRLAHRPDDASEQVSRRGEVQP